MNIQDQVQSLQNILLQLQLAASKVSDEEFKKVGVKELMNSIQDCKKLIGYTTSLQYIQEITDYSESLGLYNEM